MRRPRNHANALKHGVFAKMTILPGEDPREFAELHDAVVEEWRPVGPTEQDAVLTIAKGIWRKRRMQSFLRSERERCSVDPGHPAYDEVLALYVFCNIVDLTDAINFAYRLLSKQSFQHLEQKFRRENFSPNRNGLARSRRKSGRFCYRRPNVPAAPGPLTN